MTRDLITELREIAAEKRAIGERFVQEATQLEQTAARIDRTRKGNKSEDR
jgi:hypothetical protein